MPKVHLYPPIPSLTRETHLYTQRRSNAEAPENYRIPIETLAAYLIAEYNLAQNFKIEEQIFPNHQANELTWTGNGGVLPVNHVAIEVYEQGRLLEETIEYTILANVITLLFPTPGARYRIRAYYY